MNVVAFKPLDKTELRHLGVRHPDGTEVPLMDLFPLTLEYSSQHTLAAAVRRAIYPSVLFRLDR